MSRWHVPRMTPTTVSPLVVLQASLCRLRLLVGCPVLVSPSPTLFLLLPTKSFPIALIADSSSMTETYFSVTLMSRFSISTLKDFRILSARALNSSKVTSLPDWYISLRFFNPLRLPMRQISLAKSVSSFSFFLASTCRFLFTIASIPFSALHCNRCMSAGR
jgi:hypothetical protein